MNNFNYQELKKLYKSSNYNLLAKLLTEAKEKAPLYYNNDKFDKEYIDYINALIKVRNYMQLEYICDVSMKDYYQNKDDILNYIIFEFKRYAVDNCIIFNDEYAYNFENVDLTGWCGLASYYIKEKCDEYGIKAEVCVFDQTHKENTKLYNDGPSHAFVIVIVDDKKYLIDVTYRQFFKKNTNIIEELGVPLMCAPDVGTFMLLDEKRKIVANKILKDGWIELTDDTLKHYCDGFVIAFRNACYYEYFKTSGYTTTYTPNDYLNFLNGTDNQFNYEPSECLGRLKKCRKINQNT